MKTHIKQGLAGLVFILLFFIIAYLIITRLTRDSDAITLASTPKAIPTLIATAIPPIHTPEITPNPIIQLPTPEIISTPSITSTNSVSATSLISYTIASGDSLSSIASQFNVSTDSIVTFNQITNPDSIQEGQVLLIPPSGYAPTNATPVAVVENVLPDNESNTTSQPNNTDTNHIDVIGYSVNGYPIKDYVFGEGDRHVVFVGGIHGGYEWNTILLTYEMIDYFLAAPDTIPETVTLHLIPSVNPDGQFLVTNTASRFSASTIYNETDDGRFNGNAVDLNRNWDCQWQSESTWRNQTVSAGAYAFSEPETAALRDLFLEVNPVAVGFWHSQLNKIFASGCGELFLETVELSKVYAQGSYYPTQTEFSAYLITGDASDWLATAGIPAITIELASHADTEFDRNIAGVLAVLDAYQ